MRRIKESRLTDRHLKGEAVKSAILFRFIGSTYQPKFMANLNLAKNRLKSEPSQSVGALAGGLAAILDGAR